jgi:hypothetical protein
MNRYLFQWRNTTYRLDRGTIAFWPSARLVAAPDGEKGLQLFTNDDLFIVFAEKAGCDLDSELGEAAQCAVCIEKLGTLGYAVWSINQAMETIGATPDTKVASDLMECLVRWFFIEKIGD